jgi:hypothetical protein
MAVDSATTDGPQHREGRPGESFLSREECAPRRGRKSQTGGCGIEAGEHQRAHRGA